MNLEKIQEMWQRDSVIDPDNLHDESLKIPQLHSKYYTLYNTITLLREKARDSYNKIKLERYISTQERHLQRFMPRNHFRIRLGKRMLYRGT